MNILKSYIREVLTGFSSPSSIGPDRALGNIRHGEMTLGGKNKGLLDDLEEEEGWNDEEPLVKDKE